jgi:hypothetical protein
MRMRFESAAKVARRWESWGEAASRSSGGAYDMVCWALVGDMRPVGEPVQYVSGVKDWV